MNHRRTSRATPSDERIYDALTVAGKSLESFVGAPCSVLVLVRNDITDDLYFVTNIEDAGDLIEQFTDGEYRSNSFFAKDTRDCMFTAGEERHG